jgi:hypothetical protein
MGIKACFDVLGVWRRCWYWLPSRGPMIVHIHPSQLNQGNAGEEPYFDGDQVLLIEQQPPRRISRRG